MDDIKVMCGNWIYPSRDTTTRFPYPIDEPLVVEIFLPSKAIGTEVSTLKEIKHHLTGPRYLKVSIPGKSKIRLLSLENDHEELFTQTIDFEIEFQPEKLAREKELWGEKYTKKSKPRTNIRKSNWNAIYFTSILLQAYQTEKPLPEGIKFRKATAAEIESLGKW